MKIGWGLRYISGTGFESVGFRVTEKIGLQRPPNVRDCILVRHAHPRRRLLSTPTSISGRMTLSCLGLVIEFVSYSFEVRFVKGFGWIRLGTKFDIGDLGFRIKSVDLASRPPGIGWTTRSLD